MRANVIVFEAVALILFIVMYQGGRRALGRSANRAFLVGAVMFSLAVETAAVLGGIKNYYWYSLNSYYKHYPLGGYIIWLGLVPLAAVALWYMVALTSYLSGSMLGRKSGSLIKSGFAGLTAVLFYALIEPVAVTNHWWTWNVKSFYVIDVPLLALLGVFASVFLFTLTYRATIAEPTDPKHLKKLEDATVKRLLKSKKLTKNLDWEQQLWIYAFRLVATFIAFAAVMAPVVFVFWLVANRGHIVPGW